MQSKKSLRNIKKKMPKMQDTWLYIAFISDISDELGNIVPYPQKYYIEDKKIIYCWLIDGYFGTSKGIDYLNDIIARFKITFTDCQYIKKKAVKKSKIIPIKLKCFQNLNSRAIQKIYESTKYSGTKDYIFYCLKLHAEMIISEKGIFSSQELEIFSINNFIKKAKDMSTLKAKCKNIFNFYYDRNFKPASPKNYIKKDRIEVIATRTKHAKNMTTIRENKAKEKILNIVTGVFKNNFTKKNGTWNISKIARASKTDRRTVTKYLK